MAERWIDEMVGPVSGSTADWMAGKVAGLMDVWWIDGVVGSMAE